MIPDTQLTEWRRLAEEVTPGKWEQASKGSRIIHIHGAVSVEGVIECDDSKAAAFIAAARIAVPALLDEVERLTKENFALAADTCHAGYAGENGDHRCKEVDAAIAAKEQAERERDELVERTAPKRSRCPYQALLVAPPN